MKISQIKSQALYVFKACDKLAECPPGDLLCHTKYTMELTEAVTHYEDARFNTYNVICSIHCEEGDDARFELLDARDDEDEFLLLFITHNWPPKVIQAFSVTMSFLRT